MTKELLDLIREKFLIKLTLKTGWGRNDVVSAYDQAVSEAAILILNKSQDKASLDELLADIKRDA
jgi:hypothetical protein